MERLKLNRPGVDGFDMSLKGNRILEMWFSRVFFLRNMALGCRCNVGIM